MGDNEVRDGGEMEGRRMRGKRKKMRWKRTRIIIHAKTETDTTSSLWLCATTSLLHLLESM